MTTRTCLVEGCDRPLLCRGLCEAHYARMRKHGDPLVGGALTPRAVPLGTCTVDGCDRSLTPPHGRGMCAKHYQKWRSYGDPLHAYQPTIGVTECSVDECDKLVAGLGWCSKHYNRYLRHGDPLALGPARSAGNGEKWCPSCSIYLPVAGFGLHKSTPSGLSAYCKSCVRVAAVARRAANPGSHKRWPVALEVGRARAAAYRLAHPEVTKRQGNDRRARVRGVRLEKFKSTEIFERDGWVCGICCDAIDGDLHYPDPMSASVDHIIPIARGGVHSRANVQAAHLVCNIRKGARVNERGAVA